MSRTRPTRATARQRKLPRPEREKQMLDVAARVFARRGFHAASMDEIARECGVTKPMLYAYFRSKEGLYLATVDRAGRYLVTAIGQLARDPDPERRLHLGSEFLMRFIGRDRHGWEVLYSEGLSGASVPRHVARYRGQIVDAIAHTLAAPGGGVAADTAAIERAGPYAAGLLGAGEAVARWWLSSPGVSLEQVTAIVRGLSLAILKAFRDGAAPTVGFAALNPPYSPAPRKTRRVG